MSSGQKEALPRPAENRRQTLSKITCAVLTKECLDNDRFEKRSNKGGEEVNREQQHFEEKENYEKKKNRKRSMEVNEKLGQEQEQKRKRTKKANTEQKTGEETDTREEKGDTEEKTKTLISRRRIRRRKAKRSKQNRRLAAAKRFYFRRQKRNSEHAEEALSNGAGREPTEVPMEHKEEEVISETEQRLPLRLRGGVAALKLRNPMSNSSLKNACFSNAVLQLIQKLTLTEQLTQHHEDQELRPLCSALVKLYQDRDTDQSFNIRRLVADKSGKKYFNDGTQQDAVEFFGGLEEIISSEMTASQLPTTSDHWFKLKSTIWFKDLPEGVCSQCKSAPDPKTVPWLLLPVSVPDSGRHHLGFVVSAFFEVNHNDGMEDKADMKCGRCCSHDDNPDEKCTCTNYKTSDQQSLAQSSSDLFIQLKRFSSRRKIMTPIIIEEEFLVADTRYKTKGFILHHGKTMKSGHYTCVRLHDDNSWYLHDDAKEAKPVHLQDIDETSTYVILASRIGEQQQQEVETTREQDQQNKSSRQDEEMEVEGGRDSEDSKQVKRPTQKCINEGNLTLFLCRHRVTLFLCRHPVYFLYNFNDHIISVCTPGLPNCQQLLFERGKTCVD